MVGYDFSFGVGLWFGRIFLLEIPFKRSGNDFSLAATFKDKSRFG